MIFFCSQFLVWKAFADMLGKSQFKLPVIFENLKTPRATYVPHEETTGVNVNIFKSTGYFEVTNDNDPHPVATGKIYTPREVNKEFNYYPSESFVKQEYKIKMDTDDIYKEYHLRGYDYYGPFAGIKELEVNGKTSILKWNDNWTTFIDTMAQHLVLIKTRGHYLPLKYEKLIIDPIQHLTLTNLYKNELVCYYNKEINCIKSGGIEIVNLRLANPKKRYVEPEPTLEKYEFVPNSTNSQADSLKYSLTIATQIVTENISDHLFLRVAQVQSEISEETQDIIKTSLPKYALKKTSFRKIPNLDEDIEDTYDLIIISDLTKEDDKNITKLVKTTKFIFTNITNFNENENFPNLFELEVVYKHTSQSETFLLLTKSQPLAEEYSVVYANNNNFNWIEDLKLAIVKHKNPKARIYLINEDYNSGIVGLFNSVRMEQSCPNLRVFLIRNGTSLQQFSIRSKFYTSQLRKDLTINVFNLNQWGTYRLLPLEISGKEETDDACLVNVGIGRNSGVQWVKQSPFLR